MDNNLQYYNINAIEFYNSTVNVDMQEAYERFQKYLPAGSAILDLGCGSGRDSLHFIKKDYNVTAIDGSYELCKLASKLIGQTVINKDFSQILYVNTFHGIWANASLMHMPAKELQNYMKYLHAALKPHGFIYMSFKHVSKDVEKDGRNFTAMSSKRFRGLNLNEIFEIKEIWISKDNRDNIENEEWINFIIQKK